MDHRSDFAILTIVPETLDAVYAVFGEPVSTENREGQDWRLWEVETEDGGRLRVVIEDTLDRGDIGAQDAAALLLRAWRPRITLVADIGGGFKGRDGLGIGDLVVASGLEYYSLVKEVDGRTEKRDLPIAAPGRGPRKALGNLGRRRPDWMKTVPIDRPEVAGENGPKILPGQIVVGERLLADPNSRTVAELAARYPKALAVDMESVGIARAAWVEQQRENFTQLGVLRGISDLIDDAGLDNQETRDNAKPYAAGVAIAAAYAYVQTHPSDRSVLHDTPAAVDPKAPATIATIPTGLSDYLEAMRRVLAQRPGHDGVEFRLPLISKDVRIEDSAAPAPDAPDPTVERGVLLDIVEQDKRVVVVGKSGAGKSELLNGIARLLASGEDPVVVRIDLKVGWSRAWADQMPEDPYGEDLDRGMDALLNAASPSLNVRELSEFVAAADGTIILVDALNEVPPEAATRIRLTLSAYVRQHSGVRVLVTDRRAGLDYRELLWTTLELPTLDAAEAERIVDDRFGAGTFQNQPEPRREILRTPFFLDQALRQGTVEFTSRADVIASFLTRGGVLESDLDPIGTVAFEVLQRGETNLSEADQQRLREQGALDRLGEGGFLVEGTVDSTKVFSHQLIHQYLAGRHLARSPQLWRPDVMDAVTFDAASLDGVAMAIKSIESTEERDRFLHLVHDWNWRAAITALSEARTGDHSVSEATERAILAMAAEKRFDPVEGTRARIEGLLATVGGSGAERARAASEEEIYEDIAAIDHPEIEWWDEWKRVFLLKDAEQLFAERTLACIASEMPLTGWMLANALRRVEASGSVSKLVRMIYLTHGRETAEDAAIRWRVLHTLGAWPATGNAELLATAMTEDRDHWCRYGATRSLVEMAARTGDHGLRDNILRRLTESWRSLDPEPLSQIAWASRYNTADTSWPDAVRPLILAIRNGQEGEELERWERRLAKFENYAEMHAGR